MRKKALFWACAFIMACTSAVLANSIGLKSSDSAPDVEGTKVPVPELSRQEAPKNAEAEVNPFPESITDPDKLANLLQTGDLASLVEDGIFQGNENASLALDYPDGKLYVNKTFINGAILLTPQKGKPNPGLVHANDFRFYVFAGPAGDLYLLEPETLSIRQISSVETDGYSKEDLLAVAQPGGALLWAYDPLISGDNELISYMSNRRSIRHGENDEDIWVIDLNSGRENMVVEHARALLWYHRTLFFLDHVTNSIGSYDFDKQWIEEKKANVELYQPLNHNILAFTHPNDQTIFFYNISNNETAKMQADPSSRVTFHFRVSPDDKQILGTMFTDRRDPNSRVLFVYDVETSEVRHIKIPGKRPDLAEIRGWVDHEEFIVILRSDDGDSQAVRINSMTGEITGHIPQVYTPP